jgi:hypothetical protein
VKRSSVDALATVDPAGESGDGLHYGRSSTITFVREIADPSWPAASDQ